MKLLIDDGLQLTYFDAPEATRIKATGIRDHPVST